MTVLIDESEKRFHGSGNSGPFTWTWRFMANADILAYRILEPDESDPSREVLDLLVEGADYSITGAGSYTGGSLTLLSGDLVGGTDLLVRRSTPALQKKDLRNQGDFFPETHEDAFDYAMMVVQDRGREMSTATADINGLKPRVATAEEDVDALQAAVGGLSQAISTPPDLPVEWVDVVAMGAVPGAECTAAIIAAVAAAYGASGLVNWPDGEYFTNANIPHLHAVRHMGPGILRRVGQPATSDNVIHVGPAGNDDNDGLSPAEALLTIPAAFNVLLNYGPVLDGVWKIQLAAGTYAGGASLVGLRSINRIQLLGPDVGGHPNVPTAVINGAPGGPENGLYFQRGIWAYVQDVAFTNFTNGSDASGLVWDQDCNVYTKNVHASGNAWAGINVNILSHAYIEGGIIEDNRHGIRIYSQSSAAIGYNGTAYGNRPIIRNNTETGVQIRDCSRGHVDYCDFEGNTNIALLGEKVSRVVANSCTFTSNAIAVRMQLGSVYGESTPNTFTGNGKDYVMYNSTEENALAGIYYDRATGRWLYGAGGYGTPAAKFQWLLDSAGSGSSYHSATKAIFDGNAATNYLGLSGPTNSVTGALYSTVAKPAQCLTAYDFNSDTYHISVNGLTTGYSFDSAKFGPDQDDAKTLGDASFRWSTVYAGTGTINTSDAREKTEVAGLGAAELAAARQLSREIGAFQFRSAIAAKGADDARLHIGMTVQRAMEIMGANGLDPLRYAFICHDAWDEQTAAHPITGETVEIPAGDRYGFRADQLLLFIARGFEDRLAALEVSTTP